MLKIGNYYAGIGGNRKHWDNVDVTAIEYNKDIANVYKQFFPNDKVIITDAHQHLIENFEQFDFIWLSPPCQSHSGTNFFLKGQGIYRYPDMSLYQEILFLQYFYKGLWVVENVKPYYEPLIPPTAKLGRHYFWSNFKITPLKVDYDQIGTMNRKASKETQRKAIIREAQIPELIDLHGLKDFNLPNKRQVLRNCVLPEVGKHIFDCMINKDNDNKIYNGTLFDNEH